MNTAWDTNKSNEKFTHSCRAMIPLELQKYTGQPARLECCNGQIQALGKEKRGRQAERGLPCVQRAEANAYSYALKQKSRH